MISEELQKQIEQQAKSSAANFNYYPESSECEDIESSYVTGASKYAVLWQQAEQRAERYEKALKGLRDYFTKCNNNSETPDLITVVLSIDEALTPKTDTDDTANR